MRLWRWVSVTLLAVMLPFPLRSQDLIQMFNEGLRLYHEGKGDEALALFRKVVEINPNDGEAWVYIGTILLSKKDFDGAISALEKGLAQSLPGHIAALGWGELGVSLSNSVTKTSLKPLRLTSEQLLLSPTCLKPTTT